MRDLFTAAGLEASRRKSEPCVICGFIGQTFVNGKGWVCGDHHNVRRFELARGANADDIPLIVPPGGGKVVLR